MRIHHLRNATVIVEIGEHRLLVDPMLARAGSVPGFKVFGGGRRNNPLVPLPDGAHAALEQATAVVVTHEHPDHIDRKAIAWIRSRGLPVWASRVDAANLRRKGLDVHVMDDGLLGMPAEIVPAQHGRGLQAWIMGPVSGLYLEPPGEPSLLLTSDAVLTDRLLDTLARLQPDIVVAPAGSANLGLGGDILFSVDELVTLTRAAPGQVVLNHLEALDHCPTTREGLRARLAAEGLLEQVWIPEDGEARIFEASASRTTSRVRTFTRGPDLQKWLTSFLTMT
ncbi:MAG: MBL fold metallo-hydrolase [Myxococcota bacterium]